MGGPALREDVEVDPVDDSIRLSTPEVVFLLALGKTRQADVNFADFIEHMSDVRHVSLADVAEDVLAGFQDVSHLGDHLLVLLFGIPSSGQAYMMPLCSCLRSGC